MKKRTVMILLSNLIVTFILLVIIAGVHYYRLSNLKIIYDIDVNFKNISEDQLVQLGWVEKNHQKSHFENFDLKKEEHVFRIGVFGESFAAGSEVGNAQDFPSLLQNLIEINGIKNIEIVNFGTGGYGFSQAHLLFTYVKEKYNLDAVIFLTLSFNDVRDQNLIYPQTPANPPPKGPVHTRYYFENDQIQRLIIQGKDRVESNKIVNSILPPWDYIRLSYFLPPILRSLRPYSENYFQNPFYYDQRFSANESYDIYGTIFSKMDREEKIDILLITNIQQLLQPNVFNRIVTRNFDYPSVTQSGGLILKAPCCHMSPLGNYELAKVALNGLTDLYSQRGNFFKIRDNKTVTATEYKLNLQSKFTPCLMNQELSKAKEIGLYVDNGIKISSLYKVLGYSDYLGYRADWHEINYETEFQSGITVLIPDPARGELFVIKVLDENSLVDQSTLYLNSKNENIQIPLFTIHDLGKKIYYAEAKFPQKEPMQKRLEIENNDSSAVQLSSNFEFYGSPLAKYFDLFHKKKETTIDDNTKIDDVVVQVKTDQNSLIFRANGNYNPHEVSQSDLTKVYFTIKGQTSTSSCSLAELTKKIGKVKN